MPSQSPESNPPVWDEVVRFDELAASSPRIAQLFARLIFRERSVAAALEKPETLSVKMLSSLAGVSSWRALLRLESELERESAGFTPPALWLAWFEQVHRESAERLKREIGDLRLAPDPFEEASESLDGCIYISYAREDQAIAEHIVRQLTEAGLIVWFDKNMLRPGQDWKATSAEVIEKRCGLFLSLISEHTANRPFGNYLFERKLAARRSKSVAPAESFYLPIRIDDGEPLIPQTEPPGTEDLHVLHAPGGSLPHEFVNLLRELQADYRRTRGLASGGGSSERPTWRDVAPA